MARKRKMTEREEELKALAKNVGDFVSGSKARADLAAHLKKLMGRLGEKCGLEPEEFHASARPKSLMSFIEKARRRREDDPSKPKYTMPQCQHTDLVGARLVVPTRIEADAAIALLLKEEAAGRILLDHENSYRREERLEKDRFGYRSTHFIIALNRADVLECEGPPNPIWLENGAAALRSDDEVYQQGLSRFRFPIEVQIRTSLEDLYGNEYHNRLYKREGKAPAELERMAAKLAAALEQADDLLVEIRHRMDALRSTRIARRSPESIREELEVLELLKAKFRRWQPVERRRKETQSLAIRRAQLHAGLGEWDEVRSHLERNFGTGRVDVQSAPLRRDLARAYLYGSPVRFERARALLSGVTRLSPMDEAAWCDLGDTHLARGSVGTDAALAAYRRAYDANPRCVRARRCLLTMRIASSGDLGHLDLHEPQLLEAIQLGEDQARGGLNSPAVYFDLALLQWARCEAAMQRATLEVGGAPTRKDLDRLREMAARHFTPALDFACRGIAESNSLSSLQVAVRHVEILKRSGALHPEALDRLATLGNLLALGVRAREAKRKGAKSVAVRIVAGTTRSKDTTNRVLGLRGRFTPIFARLFREFRGLMIIPGTGHGIDAPIAKIALGRTPASRFRTGKLRLRCYEPREVRLADSRLRLLYKRVRTKRRDFSPQVALQYWNDLLREGHHPTDVRLLGVDGGWISRFEYMLCAALGGKAALVFFKHPTDWPRPETTPGGDIRAVYDTLKNEYWGVHPNILPMPFDHAAICNFLEDPLNGRDLGSHLEEAMRLHRKYQEELTGQTERKLDDSAKAWNLLSRDKQQSNLEAAAAMSWKSELATVLLTLPRERMQEDYGEPILSRLQATMIAEHGRWIVDRLLNGIRFGPRDERHRTQLVQWRWLPAEERHLDASQTKELAAIDSSGPSTTTEASDSKRQRDGSAQRSG